MFVASDLMALEAMAVLRESGRRIPEDVAVVGFDDSSAAVMADPPLTTIHQSFEAAATEAVRMLNDLIAAPRSGPRHILMPTRLVRRGSA
ncbi:MAG TPA: substrate-binding domain-containing protein [Streptosporangiaceae bacterium]|nr:substrate-binding domain-containing protein [Streptosporangiaceae bacterium]